jgi:beta-lactamase superfamily II metal-dependent hydrolase
MSIVKSLSVGDGDMFYINHNTDSFTIIDWNLSDDNKERIVDELINESSSKGIRRFISTHPDGDHFGGLVYLNSRIPITNFYCVNNSATKSEETDDFKKYCELRDSDMAFYIEKGSSRKWLNSSDETRKSAGINILWPVTSNSHFKEALKIANEGGSPNNISAIIKYGIKDGVTVLWMGDMESDFMEKIKDSLELPKVNILFAPHHGRKTGKIPSDLLKVMKPDIIIIGEADSEYLDYYKGYNTITQNSAGDVTLDCDDKQVHIYVSRETYSVDFLDDKNKTDFDNYIGTLNM